MGVNCMRINFNEFPYNHNSINRNYISIIDGIAIIFVLLNHSYYAPFQKYLGIFGVILFTFSSGFKLIFNHGNDLKSSLFLKYYLIKRVKRLIKPYIGYTILVIPIIYILIYIFKSMNIIFLNNFQGFRFIVENNANNLIYNFVIGNNPFVGQSWYLFTLMWITAICLILLNFIGLKYLLKLYFPIFLLCIYLSTNETFWFWPKIFMYGPVFIYGMFFAELYQSKIWAFNAIIYVVALIAFFLILYTYIFNVYSKYVICTFGICLPGLILLINYYINNIFFINKLLVFCGLNSFYIYLLEGPFIEPAVFSILIKFFNFPENNIVTSILVVSLTIPTCFVVYSILKKTRLNKFFE